MDGHRWVSNEWNIYQSLLNLRHIVIINDKRSASKSVFRKDGKALVLSELGC